MYSNLVGLSGLANSSEDPGRLSRCSLRNRSALPEPLVLPVIVVVTDVVYAVPVTVAEAATGGEMPVVVPGDELTPFVVVAVVVGAVGVVVVVTVVGIAES